MVWFQKINHQAGESAWIMKRGIKRIRRSIQQIEQMVGLLVEKQVGADSSALPTSVAQPFSFESAGVEPDELMTIREAYLELNVSCGTIDKLRRQGDLTSYYHNKNVRLLRSEVMAAKHWYSSMRGKL